MLSEGGLHQRLVDLRLRAAFRAFESRELLAAGRWMERWRFAEEDEAPGHGAGALGPGPVAEFDCLVEASELDDTELSGSRVPAGDRPRGRPARRACGTSKVATGVAPSLPDDAARPRRRSRVLVGAWNKREAIHMEECRVALAGLRHAVAVPWSRGCRVLSVGDNLSEILATEKGRADDHRLNALCRRSAAHQLGAEVRRDRRHVESER